MKILILLWHPVSSNTVLTAGGFKRTYEIVKRWVKKVDLIILDTKPSFLHVIKKAPHVQFCEYKIPRLIRALENKAFFCERIMEWLWSFCSILFYGIQELRRKKIDCIYVPSSELLHTTMAGVLLSKLARKRIVLVNMNIKAYTLYNKIMHKINVWLHNQADQVITISESLKKDLVQTGITNRILINCVGLDTQLAYNTPNQKKVYDGIYVARHIKEKGVFDVVEIWQEVVKKYVFAKLLMIGACEQYVAENLLNQIQNLGLEKNIILQGVVSEKEKFMFYKQSKVCLFPSWVEGWGIVPQEALVSQIPVVIYNLPVYQENILGCQAVSFVPLQNKKAFARSVIHYLDIPKEEYQKLGKTGLEFVVKFDWEKIANQELTILKELK